jgi:hypothetical protein
MLASYNFFLHSCAQHPKDEHCEFFISAWLFSSSPATQEVHFLHKVAKTGFRCLPPKNSDYTTFGNWPGYPRDCSENQKDQPHSSHECCHFYDVEPSSQEAHPRWRLGNFHHTDLMERGIHCARECPCQRTTVYSVCCARAVGLCFALGTEHRARLMVHRLGGINAFCPGSPLSKEENVTSEYTLLSQMRQSRTKLAGCLPSWNGLLPV